jgi:hypothetical protein
MISTRRSIKSAVSDLGPSSFGMAEAAIGTSLIFKDKMDIPFMATYLIMKTEIGWRRVFDYKESFINVAKKHKVPFFFLRAETPRANPDWGLKVGIEKDELMELNRVAAKMAITLRNKHQGIKFK